MTTTYEVVQMTPDLATTWLSRPWHRQRRVSRVAIERYAAAMREGRWMEPSLDPIALTEDGLLLNGQHRLSAVVVAGWTGEMLVARGVDPAMFPVIDTGRHRLAAQFVLAPQGDAIGSAARLALWYDERWPSPPRGRSLTFDNDRLLAYIDEHESDILQAVRDVAPMNSVLPRKTSAGVVYIARQLGADEGKVSEWIEGVATGANLAPEDARLTIRNRLQSANSTILRRDPSAMWMLIVRAFNAHYQDRTLAKLGYEPSAQPPLIDLSGTVQSAAIKRASVRRLKVANG